MANLTLAQFETRVAALLVDAAYSVFSTATIDAALRLSLAEYTAVLPLSKETVITCPAAGREIALSDLDAPIDIIDVWWPYDSAASSETWPPNRVHGFSVWLDDSSPVLFLSADDQEQPAADDEIRLWYTTVHTIQNLDSASSTTIPAAHESLIAFGGAGYACYLLAIKAAREITANRFNAPNYMEIAQRFLNRFHHDLDQLAHTSQNTSNAQVAAWALDKYDGEEGF